MQFKKLPKCGSLRIREAFLLNTVQVKLLPYISNKHISAALRLACHCTHSYCMGSTVIRIDVRYICRCVSCQQDRMIRIDQRYHRASSVDHVKHLVQRTSRQIDLVGFILFHIPLTGCQRSLPAFFAKCCRIRGIYKISVSSLPDVLLI